MLCDCFLLFKLLYVLIAFVASFFSKLLIASGTIESHLRTGLFQVFSQSFQVCEQRFTPALDGTSYSLLTQREVLLGLFVFESFRAFAAIELNTFEGLFRDLRNFAFDKGLSRQ